MHGQDCAGFPSPPSCKCSNSDFFFPIAQGQTEMKNCTAEFCPSQMTLHDGTLLFCANEVSHNVTSNCQQKKKHNENIYRTYYYSGHVLK